MSFWQRKNEILGINARNLLYINRYNSKANKNFADNKIFTKNYLQSRDIGAARLYAVIRNYRELINFDPKTLPDSFVIKPNRGFGGEGIIPIKSSKAGRYVSISGKIYNWEYLKARCNAILEGKYAISGLHDTVIFEELLEPSDYFADVVDRGLPDIRLVVFNMVPVLAMLRLPTRESGGRANLHLGAIGVGIDIATGSGVYGVVRGKPTSTLPNGKPISSLVIPDWEEILLIAAKAQQISDIGFLAVDISVSKTGIKVLELNARAGLDIQIANRLPLKSRITKVADLKVSSPEEGVKIATTLFSSTRKRTVEAAPKPIIGLYENIEIVNTDFKNIQAKIDPHAKINIVDETLHSQIKGNLIDIKISGKRIDLPFEYGQLAHHKYKIIIAGKYLEDFLIDIKAAPKEAKQKSTKDDQSKEEKMMKNVDRKVSQIDRVLSILTFFKPINLAEEKKAFFANRSYSPHFIYRKINLDLAGLKKELNKIPQRVEHPMMSLYSKKIKEMEQKIALLEHRGTDRIQYYSEKIYGRASRELYQLASKSAKTTIIQPDNSELLPFKKVHKTLQQFLAKHKLSHWKIEASDQVAVDMAINRRNSLILRKDAEMTAYRLQALITHEIETHIYRTENGRQQQYSIFETGTAGYAMTEEGLAVYNQNLLHLPLDKRAIRPAINMIGIYMGRKMSFAQLFDYLQNSYQLDDEEAWRTCYRVKRGLTNTDNKASFSKDVLYFAGLLQVQEYVHSNGRSALKQLYIGKIGIEDLSQLADIKSYPIKFLPASYQEFIEKT